jgi:hypothetical protein
VLSDQCQPLLAAGAAVGGHLLALAVKGGPLGLRGEDAHGMRVETGLAIRARNPVGSKAMVDAGGLQTLLDCPESNTSTPTAKDSHPVRKQMTETERQSAKTQQSAYQNEQVPAHDVDANPAVAGVAHIEEAAAGEDSV